MVNFSKKVRWPAEKLNARYKTIMRGDVVVEVVNHGYQAEITGESYTGVQIS